MGPGLIGSHCNGHFFNVEVVDDAQKEDMELQVAMVSRRYFATGTCLKENAVLGVEEGGFGN